MKNKKVYTLYEIAYFLRERFEKSKIEKGTFLVKAEINKLNYYPNGICYPELIWKENEKVVAKISGFIPSYVFSKISQKLKKYDQKLKDGVVAIFEAYLKFDEVRGFKLYIEDLNIDSFLGSLEKQKIETIEKLKKLGIFDKNKQLFVASLVKNIAIISVKTGKGFNDFKHIIEKSPYKINFQLFSASMQGENLVKTILFQLNKIKNQQFDLVVIVRGGGSDTELAGFNDFELSKAICEFPIPVWSAIGHSMNQSVVELVSNQSFITPTDLAKSIVDKFEYFDDKLKYFNQVLNYQIESIKKELSSKKEKILYIKKNFISFIKNFIIYKHSDLLDFQKQFVLGLDNFLRLKKENLAQTNEKLNLSVNNFLQSKKLNLENIALKLESNDINQIFQKGFSIVRKDGKIIKSSKNLKKGDILEINFKDNSIKVKVI